MKKQEFLDKLKAALEGELSHLEITYQLEYYNGYINEEIKKGVPEESVIDALGDPRLIAKTIIDTKNTSGIRYEDYHYEDNDGKQNNYGNGKAASKGFHATYDEQEGWDVRYGNLKLNTWYFKLIGMILLITLVVTILSVIGQVIAFVIPILIPVVIIFIIFGIINGRNRY